MDYLNSKTAEVDEQKDARRYRHGSQWTKAQINAFNKRKQPVVTYNRIGRKIDGIVGLVEKLKQSPKAYPRTPQEEGGADLATAVVRATLDAAEWKAKSYIAAQNCAVDGFGGMELLLEQGDEGDPEIGLEVIENDGFFYDPRSVRLDFTDCRYMGQGKWLDFDEAKEMFPDKADDLEDGLTSASDLSTNSDREQKWFITDGQIKRIRMVDCWYLMNGDWCWAIFSGNTILDEGKSYFHDEKKKTFCKYLMFSAAVDQEGDRYGFVRNLKSPQDEINQRRSKSLHLLNTRRIIAEVGAFDDVEIARREATKPDGIVLRNKGFEAEFDDGQKNQEIQAHLEFLVDAKSEIENFGPNPALIGQGSLGDKSGRAINLLQQAGIAELGPFLLAYRAWKIRIYRGVWNACKEHWKQERYVRVTDDMNSLQWVGINQMQIDPMTRMPQMVNHIAALDVDIIMDEGPDSITTMADTYDALLALVQNGAQVPPDIILELAPGIDGDTRKRLLEKLNAPNPTQQLEQQNAQATIAQTMADAELKKAQAAKALHDAQMESSGQAAMQRQAEAEMQLRMKDQEHQQKLVHTEQEHKLKMAQEAQKAQLDGEVQMRKADLDARVQAHKGAMEVEKEKAKQPSVVVEGKNGGKKMQDTLGALGSVIADGHKQMAAAVGKMADGQNNMAAAIADLAKAHRAPKKLVRGKDGRASHMETMG